MLGVAWGGLRFGVVVVVGCSPLCCRYDQQTLSLDFLELLLRFLPTEYERTLIGKFEREQQPEEELSEEDQFMIRFSKIPRLAERMNVMIFLGNFSDTAQLLMPVCGAAGGAGGAARRRHPAVRLTRFPSTHSNSTPSSPPPCPSSPPANCATSSR